MRVRMPQVVELLSNSHSISVNALRGALEDLRGVEACMFVTLCDLCCPYFSRGDSAGELGDTLEEAIRRLWGEGFLVRSNLEEIERRCRGTKVGESAAEILSSLELHGAQ